MTTIPVHNLATGATVEMDACLGHIGALRAAWLYAEGKAMSLHYGTDRTPTLIAGKHTVACGDWVVRAALSGEG